MQKSSALSAEQERVIIHFDYDCFYASVVENENPALKFLPLAIQQKQIIVTCNYEARRRGLRKLQLITEAKKVCPDVVIILGEDIARFRDASKELYNFLKSAIWSDRAEKLGFDEVWLDCTDMIQYNMALLNDNDLQHSFFCLHKDDPTIGFEFDASQLFGPSYPDESSLHINGQELATEQQHRRLVLGSHLARHLRHELESQKGYTSTVGIATNKILSKMGGNLNKPRNQTTIIPVLGLTSSEESSITEFMDSHDIAKVPGVGFKLAQKIRGRLLGQKPSFDKALAYGPTIESVPVRDVRMFPGMGPEMLEEVLSGPGSQKGIGRKIWGLIHGIDESEVARAKRVPTQISQEDSYMKYLCNFEDVKKQLQILAKRLIERMHIDLMEEDDIDEEAGAGRRWLAHPRTLRLSTRPQPPLNANGTRSRTFQRISRSGPLPNFVFSLTENVAALADKLTESTLLPMFRQLHSEKSGWNLSLLNIAVTNMAETGAENKDSEGRDIGRMFKQQDHVLKDFKVLDNETSNGDTVSTIEAHPAFERSSLTSEVKPEFSSPQAWEGDVDSTGEMHTCSFCQAVMPVFAASAHWRYHSMHE